MGGGGQAQVFEGDPKARSDFKAGTLYAISGIADWIYYGQVAVDQSVAFFSRRDRKIVVAADVLASPVMSRVGVDFASVGRALRLGAWKKLGKYPLRDELESLRAVVQWPVGTLDVTVWIGHVQSPLTRVEDPSIQNLEIVSAWDAVHHIPARLAVDFAPDEATRTVANVWSIGGPIWRERRVKEELARRFDKPWHQLPADWVPTGL
ncbi:hypothetical protein [Bradyrhizobium sp. JYMT SZCCT0180]|uniref:hypothetical protein n=1 Tax=Bradyrhizobium sp. JYMT SZCCT0180 TaxID=2807666 RepID=UPI001BAC6958|nr:hypothetical protein [Bradyrhizobium sp. JYMT SZCCT0180]MBR1214746.1 hypothetical protein [Bradyrhizobium sp. JYMT SZCCT0180]